MARARFPTPPGGGCIRKSMAILADSQFSEKQNIHFGRNDSPIINALRIEPLIIDSLRTDKAMNLNGSGQIDGD